MWNLFLIELQKTNAIDAITIACVFSINIVSNKFGIWPYCLITFPGTLAHELSHWILAKLFLARPRLPLLLPKRNGDQWTMGSVEFVPKIWNVIPVGLAPLLLLPIGFWFILNVMHPATGVLYVAWGWVSGNMLFASIPSSQDWKIAMPALAVVVLLVAGYYFFCAQTLGL